MTKTKQARRVSVEQFRAMEGSDCPECGKGILVHQLDHDAVEGNESVLRCNVVNPCGYTVRAHTR